MTMVKCPVLHEFGDTQFHLENIKGIIVDKTNNLIYSFSSEKYFKIWRKNDLKLIATAPSHTEIINGWDYDNFTQTLTTFSSSEIIIWDIKEIKYKQKI